MGAATVEHRCVKTNDHAVAAGHSVKGSPPRTACSTCRAGQKGRDTVGVQRQYGNPKLRTALEEHRTGHVLAVACSHEATTGAGKFRADALAGKVPKRAWG